MRPPEFWTAEGGLAPRLLAPLALAYGGLARAHERFTRPWHAAVPVVCVGNLTVGGAGKTPVALSLADRLQAGGLRVAFLSRGYGGRLKGPVEVDPSRHAAAQVGDEPLLLAAAAPTFVARDRRQAAMAAIIEGADLLIMDDGLQNPTIAKQLRLVVVDGSYGFGNGRVLPAGPLREPIEQGLARADAIVLVGEDRRHLRPRLAAAAPVLNARLVPDDAALHLRGRRVLAFAGIARPEKLFQTLAEIGAEVIESHGFPDHHPYEPDEIMRLVEAAAAADALPVTTAKDLARLPTAARALVTAVGVRLVFAEPEALDRVLAPVIGLAAHQAPEA